VFDNRRQFHYHTQGGSTTPAVPLEQSCQTTDLLPCHSYRPDININILISISTSILIMQTFYQSHISNFNLAAASEGLEVAT